MNISYLCSLTEGLNIISITNFDEVNNTDKLIDNLYTYSEGLYPCTKINNIVSIDQIELNSNATKTGDYICIFSDSPPYRFLEQCEAMKDVKQIVDEYGKFVKIAFRGEDDIVRDKLNIISARDRNNYKIFKAFPIQFNPTIDQIEKAGFIEKHDCISWLSRLDFINEGLNFEDIDEIRTTVIIDNETFTVSNKNRVKQLGSDYLYYTLGLRKK